MAASKYAKRSNEVGIEADEPISLLNIESEIFCTSMLHRSTIEG